MIFKDGGEEEKRKEENEMMREKPSHDMKLVVVKVNDLINKHVNESLEDNNYSYGL